MSQKPHQHKPVKVRVITVNMSDTNTATDDRVIDITRQNIKSWLVKHLDWCLRHKHGVQIFPIE